MKRGPNKVRALILASCVAIVPQGGMSIFAQSSTDTTTTVHKKHVSKKQTSIEKQLEEMRQQYQQQQEEIDQLKQQLQSRDQQLQQAQDTAQQAQQAAQAQAQAAQQNAAQSNEAYTNLHQAVQNVQTQAEQAQQTATMAEQDQQQLKKAVTHPDDIYYKGITISPKGSFLAAETVWRSEATGGDINTAFTGVPLKYSPAAEMSEFQATGRQSRIAIKATGKLASWTMTGYYEMDWLGTGITSNNNQSNSYVVRQRQLWADAKLNNGWDFSGGQGWSLVTETTQGETRGTEILPSTIDPQYEAGFVWARQYSFRVVKQFGDKMWLGASAESAEILNPAGSNLPTNILIGSGGTSGGLYNSTANYSFNVAPDMVAKLAFEPAPGQHYEVFGVARFFRDRIYPTIGSPYNDTVTGGGIGASGRAAVLNKKLTIGLKGLYGDGTGRYGSSTIADVTIRPDGALSPLHAFSGLSTVEFNPNKRLNIYANYSGDYIGRNYAISGGKQVGYGVYTADMSGCQIEPASTASFPATDPSVPGNATNKCSNNNKDVQELTIGYWFYIHNGTRGGLRQGIQYSNIRRDLWSGQGGTLNPSNGAHGNDNMLFTSFRYYLP
jgi:TolA-binding protein